MFGLFRKKTPIDFSEENLHELARKSDTLGQILMDNGFGFFVDYLSEIRLAADNKDEEKFKKLVISRELFGGAGALWEIHIENDSEYLKFNRQFSEYVDLLVRMGIRHGRVRQIRRTMPKLR